MNCELRDLRSKEEAQAPNHDRRLRKFPGFQYQLSGQRSGTSEGKISGTLLAPGCFMEIIIGVLSG